MCGIAGVVSLTGEMHPQQALAVKRIAAYMRSRGPDNEGHMLVSSGDACHPYLGEDSAPDRCDGASLLVGTTAMLDSCNEDLPTLAAFGHRRLGIVDLSPLAHQPVSCRDGRYWLVYNGEIYNYQEIRRELIALGVCFIGESDTEVLLQAYMTWGVACLSRFYGMFAFSVWDNVKRQLLLVRDRLGINPLYYTVSQDQLIFATDINTLIAFGLYEPKPDYIGLSSAMQFGMTLRPNTSFVEVELIEPGCYFLDHNLVEATFSIPSTHKVKYGQGKYVLRKVAEKHIAPECLNMSKKGFLLPTQSWVNDVLSPLVEACVSRLKARMQINAAFVEAMAVSVRTGRARVDRLWHLVALKTWFQQFIEGQAQVDYK